MELKHYRLIKTIAEEGSIANSSEKLFLTQSALSHQLKELESQLGFKVFFRSRNNWELSEQGQELYRLANEIFSTIDKGFNNIKYINEGAKGKVRFGTECYAFYQGLPKFIQKMAMLYPEIEVDIVLEATHQPLPKLSSGEIDMALVSNKPNAKLMSSIELFEDEIFCVLHREHHLATKEYLEAGDFAELHLIIHSFPLETVRVYEYFLKPNQLMPKKISAMPFNAVALEMVEANMGVICMPKWFFKSFKLSEQLLFKTISKNGLRRMLYLAFREEDRSKKYIQDFVDNFKEEFLDKS